MTKISSPKSERANEKKKEKQINVIIILKITKINLKFEKNQS